jgi:hypothetical protein
VAQGTSGGQGDGASFVSGALMWTERFSGGSVYALDIATGMTDTIATGQDYPDGVGATSTTYYWGSGSVIYQRARSGGGATTAATFATSQRCISLAIAPGQIYCGVYSTVANGDGVFRAALGGGAAMTRVVTEQYPSVLNRGQNVFFLGATQLGFHDALSGAAVTLLTHNGSANPPLIADDTAVYFWKTSTTSAVKKIVLTSRMESVVYPARFDEQGLAGGASDGTHLYLLVFTSGGIRVQKVHLASGVVTTLADSLPFGGGGGSPLAVTLEPTALLIGTPGVILRVAPR